MGSTCGARCRFHGARCTLSMGPDCAGHRNKIICNRESRTREKRLAADDILWRQLVKLTQRPDLTLQVQLRGAIAQAVLDRRLPPETPLPSSRRLAEILGISRNTVTMAYNLLTEEGFITARSRSRHMVDPAALENARATASRADPPVRRPD